MDAFSFPSFTMSLEEITLNMLPVASAEVSYSPSAGFASSAAFVSFFSAVLDASFLVVSFTSVFGCSAAGLVFSFTASLVSSFAGVSFSASWEVSSAASGSFSVVSAVSSPSFAVSSAVSSEASSSADGVPVSSDPAGV